MLLRFLSFHYVFDFSFCPFNHQMAFYTDNRFNWNTNNGLQKNKSTTEQITCRNNSRTTTDWYVYEGNHPNTHRHRDIGIFERKQKMNRRKTHTLITKRKPNQTVAQNQFSKLRENCWITRCVLCCNVYLIYYT